MRLSKCYRQSAGQFGCLSCHDPHVQPAEEDAPGYFRAKCFVCHTDSSCKIPLASRQAQSPRNNCIGCHMAKRNLKVISHSALTNHRIVARPDEPFPDVAFRMTTPALTDLVHLNAKPGAKDAPAPMILLEAYRQGMLAHPSYRQRYWDLAKALETAEPGNIVVLQGLTDLALQKKNAEGISAAIAYLERARKLDAAKPSDFELLARLLIATRQNARAADVLKQGIDRIPYDAELYRLLARLFFSLGNTPQACEVLTTANRLFPQDNGIRGLLSPCAAGASPALQKTPRPSQP